MRWARSTRRRADGIPKQVPKFLTTLARIAETTDRNGVPNWLSTHPQPENRAARVTETVKKVAESPGGRHMDCRSRRLSRAHRRHRLRRQSRRRHRARQCVPSSAAALRDRVSRRVGDYQQRRAGRRAGAGQQGVHGAAHDRAAAGALARSGRAAAHARVGLQGDRCDDDDRSAGCRRVVGTYEGKRVGHRQGDGARRARRDGPQHVLFIGGIASPDSIRASPATSTARFSRSGR